MFLLVIQCDIFDLKCHTVMYNYIVVENYFGIIGTYGTFRHFNSMHQMPDPEVLGSMSNTCQ